MKEKETEQPNNELKHRTDAPLAGQTETLSRIQSLLQTIDPATLDGALQRLRNSHGALLRECTLRQTAKIWGVSAANVLRILAHHRTQQILQKEGRGEKPIRHYHRTTMTALENIAKDGRFLARSLIMQYYPTFQLQGWSSSDNVLFTRDSFHEGKLHQPGFNGKDNFGATGSGVVFVMKQSMMETETYDPTDSYPSVSELPVAEHCECLLVKDDAARKDVLRTIQGTSLAQIPVKLVSEWKV
jgi:hypothetical protein